MKQNEMKHIQKPRERCPRTIAIRAKPPFSVDLNAPSRILVTWPMTMAINAHGGTRSPTREKAKDTTEETTGIKGLPSERCSCRVDSEFRGTRKNGYVDQ